VRQLGCVAPLRSQEEGREELGSKPEESLSQPARSETPMGSFGTRAGPPRGSPLSDICYDRSMNRTITQRELRNDSASVLRDVQGGQTITVTRNGTPAAELRPIPPRRFVPRAAIAEAAPRAPVVDLVRLRADLDAVADPAAHD
jgi:prevent-host-death family protein